MSLTAADRVGAPSETVTPELIRTARVTGLLYLGLAVTGMVGFLLVRNQIFVAGDAQATLDQLIAHPGLARVGIVAEMGVVTTQALVALWFFRLFRSVDSFAAGTLAAFGLVNAVAILASAGLLATALDVSTEPGMVSDAAGMAQLMYVASGHLWGVGAVFFGLWLIPMGWLVLRSGWLPRPLGWVLIVGGAGYVVSAFATYLVPDIGMMADLLVIPATVGEFWILGYLIVRGVRARGASVG